jgi:CRP/FNR family transcriptional regulator, anaerobic regulatory protein
MAIALATNILAETNTARPASRPVLVSSNPDTLHTALLPLHGHGTHMSFSRGDAVLFENDEAESCFRITSGVVVIYRLLVDGHRQIIDFLVPGDLLGLGGGRQYDVSADAVTDVIAIRYPRRLIDMASRSNSTLACWLLESVSRSLHAAHGQIVLLGSKNAVERVASFLLVFAQRQRNQQVEGEPLRLPMRRKDIADYLGLTIETVSRTFTQLRNAGAIELHHHDEVVFSDRDILEELAGGSSRLD